MARGRVTSCEGSLVLDSQGLSLYLEQERSVLAMVRSALDRGANRVVSGATLIEANHSGVKPARWNFVLSQLIIEPLSVEWSKEAARLLAHTGLHGHRYAIDMAKLCGERVTLVAV